MTKTSRYKGLVLGSFLVPEIDMIFGDGVGASLVVLTCFMLFLHVFAYRAYVVLQTYIAF